MGITCGGVSSFWRRPAAAWVLAWLPGSAQQQAWMCWWLQRLLLPPLAVWFVGGFHVSQLSIRQHVPVAAGLRPLLPDGGGWWAQSARVCCWWVQLAWLCWWLQRLLLPWLAVLFVVGCGIVQLSTSHRNTTYLLPLGCGRRCLVPGVAGPSACSVAAGKGFEQRSHNGQRKQVFISQTSPLHLPQVHAGNDGGDGYKIRGIRLVTATCIKLVAVQVRHAVVPCANKLFHATAFHFNAVGLHFVSPTHTCCYVVGVCRAQRGMGWRGLLPVFMSVSSPFFSLACHVNLNPAHTNS